MCGLTGAGKTGFPDWYSLLKILFYLWYPPAICGCEEDSLIPLLDFTFLSLVSPSYMWVWGRFPYQISSLDWVLLSYLQTPPVISFFVPCFCFGAPFCASPVVIFLFALEQVLALVSCNLEVSHLSAYVGVQVCVGVYTHKLYRIYEIYVYINVYTFIYIYIFVHAAYMHMGLIWVHTKICVCTYMHT